MNIVLSIKPQFTNLILDGSKTIEMRTKIGKNFINGATIIIYSSTPIKAIVATAKINKIQILKKNEITEEHLKKILNQLRALKGKILVVKGRICHNLMRKDPAWGEGFKIKKLDDVHLFYL